MELREWVVMTHDDVVVPEDWFRQYLAILDRTGADAATGPLLLTFDERSPTWIRSQPFATVGLMPGDEDGPTDICATGFAAAVLAEGVGLVFGAGGVVLRHR